MSAATSTRPLKADLSNRAQNLIGSEILRIAAEVRELSATGAKVADLSVGDFAPAQFPIPQMLAQRIIDGLLQGETNYAPFTGMPALRKAVAEFYKRWLGINVPVDEVLIGAGGRPLIYSAYMTLVNPGDRVVYPVPSWNNQYYTNITGAKDVTVPCGADTDFLPTATMLAPHLRGATLLVLNSPSNPTGTLLREDVLADICDAVLDENTRRTENERPLYVMYDQMYWMLTFGDAAHVNPIVLRPDMQRYTVMVDGISKSFSATGLRVGWGVGPAHVIRAMADLIAHMGAGAPRAEQVATANLLNADAEMQTYRVQLARGLEERLTVLERGIQDLKRDGFPVDCTSPRGTIYLSAQFALHGRSTPDGKVLGSNDDIRKYLLHAAGLAAIPFNAFGNNEESGWFRLSAGASSPSDLRELMPRLKLALQQLH